MRRVKTYFHVDGSSGCVGRGGRALLLGDLQLGNEGSPVDRTILDVDVQVPDELLRPSLDIGKHVYDIIGFESETREMPLLSSVPNSGTFKVFKSGP